MTLSNVHFLWLRRVGFGLLLLGYLAYAHFLAPPTDPPDGGFWDIARGRGPGRNPAVWGVFQLLGVVPLMYWALLAPDSREQKVWAWPFALGMMVVGSLALLPYLILRRPAPTASPGPRSVVAGWFGGRPYAIFVAAALVGLLFYITCWGNLAGFVTWFRTANFVHLMTIDLLVLTLLFPALLRDDMARRGVSDESGLGRAALGVPLLGPAWYLVARPGERGASERGPIEGLKTPR